MGYLQTHPQRMRQLTLEPLLNGSVFFSKSTLTDPVMMAFYTTLHEQGYDLYRTPFSDRWDISDHD